MLTPDLLRQRLKSWTADFRTATRASSPSPIEMYQRVFGLVHSLKASIQLSEDPSIQRLIATTLASDEILVKLAYAELELAPAANTNLYKLTAALDSLEPLEVFLKTALADALSISDTVVKLLELPFAWDALSRARARSATRHGYRYFRRQDKTTLTGLTAFDAALNQELGVAEGLVVVRKLDPLGAQGTDLGLNVTVIAGIPKGGAELPGSWQQVLDACSEV